MFRDLISDIVALICIILIIYVLFVLGHAMGGPAQ